MSGPEVEKSEERRRGGSPKCMPGRGLYLDK